MQVLIPHQVYTDENGFAILPEFNIFFACLFALWLTLWIRGKVSRDGGAGNVAVNILMLIAAGSVVASISYLRVVNSITTSIANRVDNESQLQGVSSGNGMLTIGIGVVFLILFIWFAYKYIKTEAFLWLILFGLGLQVLAIFNPWINSLTAWWIDNPVQGLWNLAVGIFERLANADFSF